jgi:hypothetical protein
LAAEKLAEVTAMRATVAAAAATAALSRVAELNCQHNSREVAAAVTAAAVATAAVSEALKTQAAALQELHAAQDLLQAHQQCTTRDAEQTVEADKSDTDDD